jgi:hypothetical protein
VRLPRHIPGEDCEDYSLKTNFNHFIDCDFHCVGGVVSDLFPSLRYSTNLLL